MTARVMNLDDEGATIRVVSMEEAERAACVVCMPPGPSRPPGNVTTTCHDCGAPIMFHAPTAPKTPPKVCWSCADARTHGGTA